MTTEYEFMIVHQRKMGWLAFGGIVVISLAAVGTVVALRGSTTAVAVGAPVLVFMGGFYGLLEVIKRNVSEPMRIAITPQGVRVLNRKTGLEQYVLFGEIASYQHVVASEAMGLHLRIKNGQKIQLGTNTTLHGDQNFDAMVNQFEEAVARHQQLEGTRNSLREKSFFERRISTVLMVVLSVLLAAAVVHGFITQKPLKASSFTGIAGYLSYASAWYAARRQRNS